MGRNPGKFVLSHITNFMPMYEFNEYVDRYNGHY